MNAALAYYRLGKLAEARAKFTEATGCAPSSPRNTARSANSWGTEP